MIEIVKEIIEDLKIIHNISDLTYIRMVIKQTIQKEKDTNNHPKE